MRVGKTVARVRCVNGKSFIGMMKNFRFFGFVGQKNAWLVHIVPKSGDSFVEMFFVLYAEPQTRFRISKIGKRRFLRPNIFY